MKQICVGSLIPGDHIKHPKRVGQWTRVERVYENADGKLCAWFNGLDDMAMFADSCVLINVAEKDAHGKVVDAA